MPDDLGARIEPDLYEADFVAWTERQSALLLARRVDELDWDRLAEEVGDLGESELHACTSQVTNILLHLSKIEFVGRGGRCRIGAARFSSSATHCSVA